MQRLDHKAEKIENVMPYWHIISFAMLIKQIVTEIGIQIIMLIHFLLFLLHTRL